ncbi:MAG: T9SS type A sorting domain-containing protein [Bacteroidales bacterium]|nr:T9SS type A sorting domain-containing protein [Bacteroidales bacterium]
MKNYCIVFLTIVLSVFALEGFGQSNQTLTYPVTYVEAVVDASTLQTLAHEFSVDRVDRNADGTFKTRICLSFKDFDGFLAKNIAYTTVPQTRANVQMAQNYEQMTANWNRYPTYNTYLAMMDTFRTRYPNLCEIDTILAATPGNHKILCAHISNDLNDNGGKPSVFYISTIHGDEVVGYYMMLRLIDYLLTNYNTDSYVTELVNNIDLWICPLLNPDGTYYTSNNQINESPTSIRYNRHWEDLNRVFPEAGQTIAKSDYEPEVEAMMTFMSAHNFTLATNLHGGAEVFNYPWDKWMTWQHSHADAAWWNYVGRNFADTCHLFNANFMTEEDNGVTEGGDWYVITGSMQDYHNWYLGTRHVTIEVSDSKVLSSNKLPNYWAYIKRSFLNFIAEADNGIHGTVTDSITGEPLQALVYIVNHDLDHSYVETAMPHGDYHRPIKAGQYAVTYSAEGYLPKTIVTNIADGQRLEQNVQLAKVVGVESYEQCVVVYPNPAKDVVNVELADGIEIDNITLYDIHGRHVETRLIASLQRATIDVRGLPAGTYFLHLRTTDNREFIRKMVHE